MKESKNKFKFDNFPSETILKLDKKSFSMKIRAEKNITSEEEKREKRVKRG